MPQSAGKLIQGNNKRGHGAGKPISGAANIALAGSEAKNQISVAASTSQMGAGKHYCVAASHLEKERNTKAYRCGR